MNSPRTFASFAFEGFIGLRFLPRSSPAKVRKALLSRIYIAVFFIVANGIKRFRTENTDDGAEDICLLIVKLDEIRQLFL